MSGDEKLAFPVTPEIWGTHPDFHGMTLRDWFAGQVVGTVLGTATGGPVDAAIVAQGAYLIADAMLSARAAPSAPADQMQHVAYFDEGEFHWMSGIKPRACELYAAREQSAAPSDVDRIEA